MPSIDLDLLERCRSGDREAFRTLVAHWGDRALRTAYVITHDRARAAEATRQAFLACWRELPSSHTQRPFRPWLLGLVAREALERAPQEGTGCVDRLPGRARIAAVLHVYAGMGTTEVAAALGTNAGAAARLLRGAMKELRACEDGAA